MAMRSVLLSRAAVLTRSMETTRGATRYFSDGKGRILSEEERAKENVYIQVRTVFPLGSFEIISDLISVLRFFVFLFCKENGEGETGQTEAQG